MFYLLAHSADAFFCPALQVLVDSLQLSPNTAGVTFLSFGNGAPGMFRVIRFELRCLDQVWNS